MGGSRVIARLLDAASSVVSLIVWVALTKLVEVLAFYGRTLSHREHVVRGNGFAAGWMAWRRITADC